MKLGLKDLLAKANPFNRNQVLSQLSKCAEIKALNPVIRRGFDFVLYETYREVVESVLKSNKYRSFGDVLSQLFRQEALLALQARKKERGQSRESNRSRGREAAIGNRRRVKRHTSPTPPP